MQMLQKKKKTNMANFPCSIAQLLKKQIITHADTFSFYYYNDS